jgi:uncharacterized protein
MSEYLDLYNYRRQVADSYRTRDQALQTGADAEQAWQRFRSERNQLFAQHPQSALDEEQRHTFQGLPYFPYQPALCVLAEIDTTLPPQRSTIVMNAEETMTASSVGRLHFTVEGEAQELTIYWLEIYGGGLFLPFRDTSSPLESYGGGRYLLDTIKGSGPVPGGDGKKQIMLDFNYAYNPSCAYNSRWVCPLAPQENRLAVPIRAGEKKYEYAV